MKATRDILVFVCAAVAIGAMPDVRADFRFGEPVNLTTVIPAIDPVHESIDCFSADGLEIYVESDRPGGLGNFDLWVLRRASIDEDWRPPENLGPAVNSPQFDNAACISADGLMLYLHSTRPGGHGGADVYVTTRATKNAPWNTPVNLGPKVNSSSDDGCPWISADGRELYLTSWRRGGYGQGDIYVAGRPTTNDPWGESVNLGSLVNSPYEEAAIALSPDGLLLLFSDNFQGSATPRPGGYGGCDMWMTRRASPSSPWQAAVSLGPQVNSAIHELIPRLSPDGSTLYFSSARSLDFTTWENWQAPILPVVDFNGDGKVDAADMARLMDNWGKSNSPCDIGPYAWGNGVVDEQDLRVLLESVVTPGPRASDVLCDVVLNWISPSFAQTCDVYFGTSQEAVSSASRADPQGVLVSQGQTATMYDPPGLLEFSRIYYWRVDFVMSGPTPAFYKGPVLTFTTAALTYPIKNVTATASSFLPGSGPEKTVNGSGLDGNGGHSTEPKDMWWSLGAKPNWIQYEFDRVYPLHELWVWNFNSTVDPVIGFGAKTVKIEYSTNGTAWTALANVPDFARAPGKPGYTADTKISFGGVPAQFVRLTIEKNWGVAPQTGLSEVRFFAIQNAAVSKP